ncbi:hypothetical protein EIP86_010484 [Pleurotus ostreatoroseus]|nr:hypothetical protein EIP86_010484 [Pleurotus ostreatoroseus]
MPIPRSQSTPHVAGTQPFLAPHALTLNTGRPERPKLPRHRSALALSESTSAAASSGRHTPLSERTEDPFSLTGFFSPGLSVTDESCTWDWLRARDDDTHADADSKFMASGCVSPISEEDADLLATQGLSPIFDKLRDQLAAEAIREEDKLGILSVREPTVLTSETAPLYEQHILSRYSEGDPEDDNALYEALLALRLAHVPSDEAKKDTGIDVRQGLFSPVDRVEDDSHMNSTSRTVGTSDMSFTDSVFLGPSSPPSSHLHFPMGSPSPLDPQDHFAPQETPALHDLSRSGSPPQVTLDSLVNPAHPANIIAMPPSESPATSSSAEVEASLNPGRKSAEANGNGHNPTWAPKAAMGHPPRPSHGALPGPSASAPQRTSTKRKLDASETEDPHAKIRRVVREHVMQNSARPLPMTTVLCLHAAVAQKSYGSEKRFLCPPPIVHIEGPVWNMKSQQLSMAVIAEGGERSFEQRAPVDHNLTASFKFLHVTGSAKSKSFQLSLDIAEPPHSAPDPTENAPLGRIWASFESAPVTIISKPSKKTAKTRNIGSCILAGGPVSLFNRINSQTVRTKYMTVDSGQISASNLSWSAFNMTVTRPYEEPPAAGPAAVTYGSEVVLHDTLSGIHSTPLIIRKVDKGRIAPDDGGPVSQMQKIALQRAAPDGQRQYLSAAGPASTPGVVAGGGMSNQAGTHALVFQPPRVREEMKDGQVVTTDEVDDYLCWTIVGISKFQYTFFDAFGQNNHVPEMPITPFPTLFTAPAYRASSHSLELTIANFFYEDSRSQGQRALDIYLGNLGPLNCRIYKAPPPGPLTNVVGMQPQPPHPHYIQEIGVDGMPRAEDNQASMFTQDYMMPPIHNIVMVDLPPMEDIIKALEDEASNTPNGDHQSGPSNGTERNVTSASGRSLPLLFIRSYDGVGYHSGRSLQLENVFQAMDLAANAAGAVDQAWLAAAQAAATVEGGLHGWTLRVL